MGPAKHIPIGIFRNIQLRGWEGGANEDHGGQESLRGCLEVENQHVKVLTVPNFYPIYAYSMSVSII